MKETVAKVSKTVQKLTNDRNHPQVHAKEGAVLKVESEGRRRDVNGVKSSPK